MVELLLSTCDLFFSQQTYWSIQFILWYLLLNINQSIDKTMYRNMGKIKFMFEFVNSHPVQELKKMFVVFKTFPWFLMVFRIPATHKIFNSLFFFCVSFLFYSSASLLLFSSLIVSLLGRPYKQVNLHPKIISMGPNLNKLIIC